MTNKLIVVNKHTGEERLVARFQAHHDASRCADFLQSLITTTPLQYAVEWKERGLNRNDAEALSSNVKKRISIQICHKDLSWENTPATFHDVKGADSVAQAIADATGMPVRMTFITEHSNITDVSRNNGAYIYPKQLTSLEMNS